MFLQFAKTSVGRYHLTATVQGSYGETIHTAVGRNYNNVQQVTAAALRLMDRPGYRDVTVVDSSTKRHIDINAIVRSVK